MFKIVNYYHGAPAGSGAERPSCGFRRRSGSSCLVGGPAALFLCVLLSAAAVVAEESYKPTTDWKADWITVDKLADDSSGTPEYRLNNLWLTFRKNFDLKKVPEKALARIACDSKYWLYVNGEMVVFEGQLKRGPTPKDTYHDVVDLAKHLKPGKNVVAVLMWYFGKDGFSHKNSGVPGFLFDCQADGFELLSDATWKATPYTKFEATNPVWKDHPYSAYERITADPQPNFRLPESNIRYDARFEFKGNWTALDFDDADWGTVKQLGKPPVAPWNELYERPIPLWKDYGVKDYVNKSEIPAVSDGKPIVCKLPYNAQVTPLLKVDAPEGYCIDMRTDNYQGGGEYNVRAEYVTKSGVQEYESLGWMNGHSVIYTMPAGVKILSLQYRETGYDTEFAGSFECDDPFFNELWKKSARTLYVTMRDTYFDCPDRERAQWWGDEVNELGEAFYVLDPKSALLARKGMYELMRWQRDDGVIYSPVPSGNWNKELPMQMLASIGKYGFELWCEKTGDMQPLKDLYPRINRYLDVWQLGDDNLILHRTGAWDWGDWGQNIDLRVLANCWYVMAVQTRSLAGRLVGDTENSMKLAGKAAKVVENFDKVFWTGTEYRDPKYKGETDDRANAMAVISGIAEEDKYPAIREVLLKQKHASPYMEKYVLEALFKMGYEDDAFARMKERFKKMVEHPDYTTLWEGWGIGKEGFGGGTINHAWSGGGLTMLSQYAAGVHCFGPDCFLIMPQPGPLKWLKSKTPTVYGDLKVDIERNDKKCKMTVVVPKNVKQTLVYLPKRLHQSVTTAPVELERTDLKLFHLFVLPAGTWTFETVEK